MHEPAQRTAYTPQDTHDWLRRHTVRGRHENLNEATKNETAESDGDDGDGQSPERLGDKQVERAARPSHPPADVDRRQSRRHAKNNVKQSVCRITEPR